MADTTNSSFTGGPEIIPCFLPPEARDRIARYADELRAAAPRVGSHGLSHEEFWDSGLFQGAIERLRGSQAASTSVKRRFLDCLLAHMQSKGAIASFRFTGSGDRHDYQVEMPNGRNAVFEAKGCLDGNNTTIFQRPPNADEFFIWSLCQNPGADPRHNAWSGIHTRLGGVILAESQRVDALVILDMLCGTVARRCPKLAAPARSNSLANGRQVPPPCIYLFPRRRPVPRSDPNPPVWKIAEFPFICALATVFGTLAEEVVQVHIETRMSGVDVQRKTTVVRAGHVLAESRWTTLKRASR